MSSEWNQEVKMNKFGGGKESAIFDDMICERRQNDKTVILIAAISLQSWNKQKKISKHLINLLFKFEFMNDKMLNCDL